MFEKLSTAVMNFVSSLGAPVTGEADYTFFDGQTLTAQTISYTVTPEQLAAFFTELGSAVGQEIDVSGVNTDAVVTVYTADGNHGAFVSAVGGSTVTFEFVGDTASSKVAFRVVADENGRVAFTADGTVTPADGGAVYDMTVASDEVDGTVRVIAAAADDTHFTVDYSMDMTEKSGAKTAVSYILQVELLDAAAVTAEVNGAFAGAQEVSVMDLLGGSGTEMLNAAQEILMPALQTLQQLPGVAEAIGV